MRLNTTVIAEIGVNHNGSTEIAKKMIDEVKNVGADVAKFQSFKAENLCKEGLSKEKYQKKTSNDSEDQFEMLEKLELSQKDTILLKDYTESKGLEFMSTPYDEESLDFLISINVERIKIGSGEITDHPFLESVAKTNKPIILSTGASTLKEVKSAVKLIQQWNKDLCLLHCTSTYPTILSDVNLNVIKTLKEEFNLPIGYSDHTQSLIVPSAAVAIGANIIEKHFTLDKFMDGPDHLASLEPIEFKKMIKYISETEQMLGHYEKMPVGAEEETIKMGRRSILVKRDIKKGEVIKKDMLITKRPGTGIQPFDIDKIIGKIASFDLYKDHIISFDDLD